MHIKFYLLAFALVLAGCALTATDPDAAKGKVPSREQLIHHHYNLDMVDGVKLSDMLGQQLETGKRPDIEFQEGFRLAGIAGCNRFMGQGKLDQGALSMAPGPSTRMACIGELSKVEQTVFTVLHDGAQIRIKDQQLILLHQDHTLVYQLADYVY
ncbi:META domain-containing protein [Neiella sp. HB171785]|uniref:META domain-containing protein n=1 Tax=Neiella litorisoli TaxID=2771431 RepID=A0A8J6QVS3_9GAMM|nr:META domain-containing protein [Neiella litorisoli]MBD1391399.1 META domain-containing protein [Neiella litorisoli]